jgi:hypothetical protein
VYLLVHPRSPELRALTVAFAVGLADGFSERALAGKLKPLHVARLVAPGKYPDGDGLYLVVAGPASRNWSYRYWINGKQRWHGLGSLNDLSLRDARIRRDAARQQVRAGVDIVQANGLPGKMPRPFPQPQRRPRSRNALKDILRKIGESGAKSTALNGPRRSIGTPTR